MPLSRTDDDQLAALAPRLELDPAAGVGVLGGIDQQIGEHLREPHRVGHEPHRLRGSCTSRRVASRLDERPRRLLRGGHDRGEVDRRRAAE